MTAARTHPAVSVIVVTRDRPRLLLDALRSVDAQTLRPLEVRVVDDGGGSSLDVLAGVPLLELTAFATSYGQAGLARNAAAEGARGEVLAFLDDDDLWAPAHLAGLAEAFVDPAVGMAWRDSRIVRETLDEATGERRVLDVRVLARDWEDGQMRRNDYLPPSAWGVRRDTYGVLGGFDPAFRYSEDWDFLLRARAIAGMRRVPGATVEVRLRERGNTSSEMGSERRACLERLAARHRLEPIAPKTFWDVALELGVPA